jgi:hypothetical protein
MSIDHRLAKLKGHAIIFSREFRDIIENFEMLAPVAENRELPKNLSETKRKPGIGIVRWSLVQTCIIGITKLAYDQASQNPSVRNLIEDILDPPSQTLRDKLKYAFSIAIKPALIPGDTPTEEVSAFWKEIERIEVQELQQDFDRYLPQLESNDNGSNNTKKPSKNSATNGLLTLT